MCEVRYIKAKVLFPIIKDILISGKGSRINITGMSMYPFLREYIDSVELSITSFDNLHCSDIVLILRKNGEYVLHRVLKKEEDCFYIIGDAQQWIEGPLYPDQLIAVVSAVWRKDKRIDCSNFWWKFLSLIWLKLIPFRHFLIRVYKCLRKIIKASKNFYRRVRT